MKPRSAAEEAGAASESESPPTLLSIDNRRAQLIKLLREALAISVREDTALVSTGPFAALVEEALEAYIAEVQTPKTEIEGLQKELDDKDNPPSDGERAQREAAIARLKQLLSAAEEDSGKEQAAKMLEAFRSSALPSRVNVEQALSTLAARLEEQHKAAIARTDAQLKDTALKIQALDTQRVGSSSLWLAPRRGTPQAM